MKLVKTGLPLLLVLPLCGCFFVDEERTVVFRSVAVSDVGIYQANDELKLASDGRITLSTISPIIVPDGSQWRVQNKIGTFAYKASPQIYKTVSEALAANRPGVSPNADWRSGFDSLHFEGEEKKSIVRSWAGQDATIDRLAPELSRLKSEALKHPVAGAELSCTKNPSSIVCRLQNLSDAPFAVPNPDNSRFFCTDPALRLVQLKTKPKDAKADGPKQITLAGKGQLEFRFQPLPKEKCSDHLVLRASDPKNPALLISNEMAAPK